MSLRFHFFLALLFSSRGFFRAFPRLDIPARSDTDFIELENLETQSGACPLIFKKKKQMNNRNGKDETNGSRKTRRKALHFAFRFFPSGMCHDRSIFYKAICNIVHVVPWRKTEATVTNASQRALDLDMEGESVDLTIGIVFSFFGATLCNVDFPRFASVIVTLAYVLLFFWLIAVSYERNESNISRKCYSSRPVCCCASLLIN